MLLKFVDERESIRVDFSCDLVCKALVRAKSLGALSGEDQEALLSLGNTNANHFQTIVESLMMVKRITSLVASFAEEEDETINLISEFLAQRMKAHILVTYTSNTVN